MLVGGAAMAAGPRWGTAGRGVPRCRMRSAPARHGGVGRRSQRGERIGGGEGRDDKTAVMKLREGTVTWSARAGHDG